MICEACRDRQHGECRGGNWCDCQHKPPAEARPAKAGSGADHGPNGDEREDGPEPGINWLRQG